MEISAQKLKRIREITKNLKRIKKMKDEFDFDALLDDVESTEKEVKNEVETQELEDVSKNDGVSGAVDGVGDDKPDDSGDTWIPDYEIEKTEKTEPKTEVISDDTFFKETIKKLEEEIKKLKGALIIAKSEEAKAVVDKVDYSDLEFSEESKSFLKAHADLELEKKELQGRFKDLKDEYEEQGVHTKQTLKAFREVQKQFKETAEEAQEIEQLKAMIDDDDNLKTLAATLSE